MSSLKRPPPTNDALDMEGLSCTHRSCRIALAHREATFFRKVEGLAAQRQRVVMRAMADLARQCRQQTLALALDRWYFVVTRGKLRRLGLVRVVWERWYRLVLMGRREKQVARVVWGVALRLYYHSIGGAMRKWLGMTRKVHSAVQMDTVLKGEVGTQTRTVSVSTAAMQTQSLFQAQVGCQTRRVVTLGREVQTNPQLRPSRMTQTRLQSRVAGTQTPVRRLVSAGVITDRIESFEVDSQTCRVETVEGGAQVQLEVSETSTQTTMPSGVTSGSQTEVVGGIGDGGEAKFDVGVQAEPSDSSEPVGAGGSSHTVSTGVQTSEEGQRSEDGPITTTHDAECQAMVMVEGVTVGVQTDDLIRLDGTTSPLHAHTVDVVEQEVQTGLVESMAPTAVEVGKVIETVSIGSIEWDDVARPTIRSSIMASSEVHRIAPVPHVWPEGPSSSIETSVSEGVPKTTTGRLLPARYRGHPHDEGARGVVVTGGTAVQTSPGRSTNMTTQTVGMASRSFAVQTDSQAQSRANWVMAIRCLRGLVFSRLRYGFGLLLSNRLVWDNKELADLVVGLQGRIDSVTATLRDRDLEVSQLRLGIEAHREAETQAAAQVEALTAKCQGLEEMCSGVAGLEERRKELEGRCEALFDDNVELAASLEKALEGVHRAERAERRVEELQIMLANKVSVRRILYWFL